MLSVECAEAFFFNRHKVLGKTLKPFCLYHHFVLEALKSPLMTGGQASIIDLYIATLICQQEYPISFKKIPSSSWWSILWNSIRFGYYSTRYKFSREVSKFYNYAKDYSSTPQFWENQKNGAKADSGVPDVIGLMVSLMVGLKYTEKEAWNCPIGKAVWLTTTNAILNGSESKIISAEAKAYMEEMRKSKGKK
jgi:hypothetical protein